MNSQRFGQKHHGRIAGDAAICCLVSIGNAKAHSFVTLRAKLCVLRNYGNADGFSNLLKVQKKPSKIGNPVFNIEKKFNYNVRTNGIHFHLKSLWVSVVGVFSAPSRHFLNHTSIGVAT